MDILYAYKAVGKEANSKLSKLADEITPSYLDYEDTDLHIVFLEGGASLIYNGEVGKYPHHTIVEIDESTFNKWLFKHTTTDFKFY